MRFLTLCLAAILSASAAVAAPYNGKVFQYEAIAIDPVNDWIAYVGEERHGRISPSGAVEINLGWEDGQGPLVVEQQRVGFFVLRAGIAARNEDWIDIGLKAIEWGLQDHVLGPESNFPEERERDTAPGHALHPRSIFVAYAAQSVLLVKHSDVPHRYKRRALALVPAIGRAATSFVETGDADKFFKVPNSSQLAFVATGIQLAGKLTDDKMLQAKAKEQMQHILGMQRPDGAFLEKHGHDTSYQMNTLDLTTTYASTLSDGAWKRKVMAYNRAGADWFLARVDKDGIIDNTGNTRTAACDAPVIGDHPKGQDIDVIPTRLYYYAALDGRIAELGAIIDKIQYRGQSFDHIVDC